MMFGIYVLFHDKYYLFTRGIEAHSPAKLRCAGMALVALRWNGIGGTGLEWH